MIEMIEMKSIDRTRERIERLSVPGSGATAFSVVSPLPF